MVELAKYKKDEDAPMMVRTPTGGLRPSAAGMVPASAEPAEPLAYRTGRGLRETVVPALATGAGRLVDIVTAPMRLGLGAAQDVAAGFTGAPPSGEEFKFFSAAEALPQAVARGLAPEPAPTAAPIAPRVTPETTAPEPRATVPPPTTGLRAQPAPEQTATQIAPVSARQAAVSQGLRFGTPEEQELYERVGLQEMMRSPYPGFQTGLYTDPKTGESSLIERISGGAGGPALRQPFVSPRQFRSVTGYDREGNPVYSSGAAEMAAANAAIAEYNKALLQKYGAQTDIWEAGQVGIPKGLAQADLFQAQAGLADVRAEELPREGASLRAMRAAQMESMAGGGAPAQWVTLKVPGPPDTLGGATSREVLVNPATGAMVDPLRSPAQQLESMTATMPEERKSVITKYWRNNPNETESSILQKIQAGEL